ncbi:MAG: lamin tail domain-containing protein [Myxococcota bacterium]
MDRSSWLLSIALLASCSDERVIYDDPAQAPEPSGVSRIKDLGGPNGGFDYCDGTLTCATGEGDCDLDTQCDAGLVCVDDIGSNWGFGWTTDVCAPSHCEDNALSGDETAVDFGGSCGGTCGGTPNTISYCHPGCECASGVGDCNADTDCATGLVCGLNNGAQFGIEWSYDVCVESGCTNGVQDGAETGVDFGGSCGGSCGGANGDQEGYCSESCPCASGEGDCDSDAECDAGLSCVADRGGDFGMDPKHDVCLAASVVTDLNAGDLVITEIMSNPDKVVDSRGEYFELHNTTNSVVNLNGLYVRDAAVAQSFTVAVDLFVQPNDYVVFAKNGNAALNGGFTGDYDYNDVFVLLGSDQIRVEDGTGFIIDQVVYNLTWPQPVGKSIELDRLTTDSVSNDTSANWCESIGTLTLGDRGSPGAQNRICP